MNNCNCCYYNDAKENICTHGSPIFIDDVCTDYQDSEFVVQIRADVIDEFASKLKDYVVTKRMQGIEPYWAVAVYEVSEQLKSKGNKLCRK